jgi:hypothetical protein
MVLSGASPLVVEAMLLLVGLPLVSVPTAVTLVGAVGDLEEHLLVLEGVVVVLVFAAGATVAAPVGLTGATMLAVQGMLNSLGEGSVSWANWKWIRSGMMSSGAMMTPKGVMVAKGEEYWLEGFLIYTYKP